MKNIKSLVVTATLATAAFGMVGCSNMSKQDRNTAIGAVTGGSALGTVGGAAVGGVIGNQVKTTN